MKMFFKSFLTLSLLVLASAYSQAQTVAKVDDSAAKSETVNCKPSNCDPAKCDAMVAAGLCTKEQAAKCKAKAGTTKVASAKMERSESNAVVVSNIESIIPKKASCAKTCEKKKSATPEKSIK
jgi:hypothetical protein